MTFSLARRGLFWHLVPIAMLVVTATFASPMRAAERLELNVETPEGWQKQETGAALILRPQGGREAGALIRVERHDGSGLDPARVSRTVSDSYLTIDRDADIAPPTTIETRAAGAGLQLQILYAVDHVSRAAWVVIVGGADKGVVYALHYSAPESAFAVHQPIAQAVVERMSWAPIAEPPQSANAPDGLPVHRCDELAAHPEDLQKPTGVRGVEWGRLQAAEAIAACTQALAEAPSAKRYAFQLARSLYKAERYREALPLLRGAAESGSPMGILLLASAYEEGLALERNPQEAFRLRRQVADAGNAIAIFAVGAAYSSGTGVTQDEAEAVVWYRRAAEAGNSDAMNDLGRAYDEGRGIAVEKAPATAWYRKAAEAGNAVGMFNLALHYRTGEGVARDDAAALQWFQRAAELGNGDAMSEVGFAYGQGVGVAPDPQAAVKWYRDAAEAGSIRGMLNLAVVNRNGEGVARNYGEAMRWFAKAEAAGNGEASYSLAQMYALGWGVKPDPAAAASLMIKALELGYPLAHREMAENSGPWGAPFRRELQSLLKRRGVYSGPVDGTFGPGVARAIASLSEKGVQP